MPEMSNTIAITPELGNSSSSTFFSNRRRGPSVIISHAKETPNRSKGTQNVLRMKVAKGVTNGWLQVGQS
jgi:hypothetical protein